MRRLIHYSDQPLTSVLSTLQDGERFRRHGGRKPVGLWVSSEGEDDWPSWCASEEFRDCSKQIATEIILSRDHGVLLIDTDIALRAFHHKFAFAARSYGIDWKRVAALHSGIVISPYQWGHRLDGETSDWYYGWDCASGCIWSASAIADLIPLKQQVAA